MKKTQLCFGLGSDFFSAVANTLIQWALSSCNHFANQVSTFSHFFLTIHVHLSIHSLLFCYILFLVAGPYRLVLITSLYLNVYFGPLRWGKFTVCEEKCRSWRVHFPQRNYHLHFILELPHWNNSSHFLGENALITVFLESHIKYLILFNWRNQIFKAWLCITANGPASNPTVASPQIKDVLSHSQKTPHSPNTAVALVWVMLVCGEHWLPRFGRRWRWFALNFCW